MIHQIDFRKVDEELLAKCDPVIENTTITYDYRDAIVKKPWGYEYLVFENQYVAIWLLHISRTQKTSMHSHPQKRTSLVLLHGSAQFSHTEGTIQLDTLDGVIIKEGAFHSTEACSSLPIAPQSQNGIFVLEIESPPKKYDLVRLKDAYGRAGTAYEGIDNVVFEHRKCLKLQEPKQGEVVSKNLLDCVFTVRQGLNITDDKPEPNDYVSVVGKQNNVNSNNPYLQFGGLTTFKEFCENTKDENLSNYTILTIEREKKLVRLSDYVFSYIEELGVKEVFGISGGGAMHLVDAVGKNKNLEFIATHHEQAAAMAAESYSRITRNLGVALVTSGPGGTNTITGVCGAWIDSIPTVFISGQVSSNASIGETGLRQYGIQETDIVNLVKPITKYAEMVKDPNQIKYHLQKAIYLATTGRSGPVWLDIPLDVQSKLINVNELPSFNPNDLEIEKKDLSLLKEQVIQVIDLLKQAKRPVIITGYGVRLSKAEEEINRLIDTLKIPVVTSWTTSDLFPNDHEFYVGRSGIMGDRGSNFAVQNSDLLLIIGSRMSIPQVGYNYSTFAREAKKIMVDIDKIELQKPSISPDLPIQADAKDFMIELLNQVDESNFSIEIEDWLKKCQGWKAKYPIVLPEYKDNKESVNSFYFVDCLSKHLDEKAIVVTDMGTSFTCTMQTFKIKKGQRLFTSSGHASMGFGLPGSIGACFGSGKRKTICISGDGGLQMNIQELQTLVHYKLPIVLFVLNNGGYLTIKLMQQNHFGRYVGSEKTSGVTCPDIVKVAGAYGIKADRISNHDELHAKLGSILAEPGPYVCEIMMSENQPLIPRISSLKKPDGTIIAKPLEDLYPFLDRKEFFENMIVKPIEILNE